jgi:hypothetical protein
MKGKIKTPTFNHTQLCEILDYDAETGVFRWKISPARNVKVGAVAGSKNDSRGYSYIKVLGFEVTTSRLAWFYVTEEWPRTRVQFKNRNPLDARFENLSLSLGLHGDFDFTTREGRIAYQRARRKATPHLEKGRALRESFNISLDQYLEMHDRQGGKCAICGQPEMQMRNGKIKALAVDHNHKTGAIRGLLCSDCNTGIGKLKDDVKVLQSAIRYLNSQQST